MAPKSHQQLEGLREEKKALIMDTALKHFANQGFHATTISHIAKEAGISKGLLYNYFKSKEDLLSEIVIKSVSEVYTYLDINRDGYLTGEEFEFFIRKLSRILCEKRIFWRLFFQVLMQTEVREKFLGTMLGTDSLFKSAREFKEGTFVYDIMKVITEYFERKKAIYGDSYDPWLDMNMFLLTIKGFAITYVFIEPEMYDDDYFEKTVDYIIETYK